jgi:hypothetical protein
VVMVTWYRRFVALGSPGLEESVSVAAPVRTCTGGHSKLAGKAGAPGAADALALEPAEVNQSGIAGIDIEGIEGSEEQPARSGINTAEAVHKLPRGNLNPDTPTPHMPPRLGPQWLTPSKSAAL